MVSSPDKGEYPYANDHAAMWVTFVKISKWVMIGLTISLILMAAFLTGSPHAVRI